MTVTIDERLATRIQAMISGSGESPDGYIVRAIEGTLVRDERSDRPDNYDPVNGKGKPFAQFVDDMRKKHGLPENWDPAATRLTDADWDEIDEAHAKMYPDAVEHQ